MSIYITVNQPPKYHQMTLEELLFSDIGFSSEVKQSPGGTVTYKREEVTDRLKNGMKYEVLRENLISFNRRYDGLMRKPRMELYNEFYIPKRSGGLRKIDAPCDELMKALNELKDIFEVDFKAKYHTSAYAYIHNRSTVDAVKKHQSNESRWFGMLDLSNFFGSITLEYALKMLSQIFPFSMFFEYEEDEKILECALELGFLDGGLPQGSPLSPMLTNLIMIPIDFKLANTLNEFEGQKYIYTRYADDFQISSRYNFDIKQIVSLVGKVLHEFDAPFKLNEKKTRYTSASGQTWMLGVLINQDLQMSVGHKNKKIFKAMLSNYITDHKNGIKWPVNDVQVLNGHKAYYNMVEPKTIGDIIDKMNTKYNVNVEKMMLTDIKGH